MYVAASNLKHLESPEPRARAKVIWLVAALSAGAVASAPLYLHFYSGAGLFSAHPTTSHATMPMGSDTPAPKPEHQDHAFCFFCVVLMTLLPSVTRVARMEIQPATELRCGELELHLKPRSGSSAEARAPPPSRNIFS